jgi:adenylate cyclase class 2
MKALRETEIKLPVPQIALLRRRLKALGFRVSQPRRFESNRLFDFADQRLRRSRRLLRLRYVSGDCLLTFKGPPFKSLRHKVRDETESHIANGNAVREIFRSLGLRETFRYDKYRTTYARRRDDLKRRTPPLAELDETPIGNYLELEGPSSWIDAVARELGYEANAYITASYAALYFQDCRRKGKRPGNMVFVRGK